MRALGLVAAGLTVATGTSALAAGTARVGKPVMGTVFQATVVADDAATARRLAKSAVAAVEHWDDVLTTWRPEGELARLNAAAGDGRVPVSSDLRSALESMLELHRATKGAFDPAVGRRVTAFRKGETVSPEDAPRPLDQVLSLGRGWAELEGGIALDAGGIGKGIALDAAAALLRREGALGAFLDFGGSTQLAFGAPPPDDQDAWTVLLAGLDIGQTLGTLRLENAALSTSRARTADDESGTIVDPRNGRPVPPPRLATVLAPNATVADAWSTAAIVLTPSEALSRLEAAGLEGLVSSGDGLRRTGTIRGLSGLPRP